ncbi:MAG: AAA family ATPase [Polyangiaceae bacterium]|nr:AAA family ATPase [Polyangiaceae bacterium]
MEQLKSPPGARPALPEYDLGERLHDSATSAAYRATRLRDECPVILKVLKPDFPEPDALVRYEQEYEILRGLQAPGIVRAWGVERYRQTAVLVLEDFGGSSLDVWLARWWRSGTAGLTVVRFLELAIRIAEAISQVHAGGVVHRDINPTNLVLNPETNVLKVIDFGLATRVHPKSPHREPARLVQGTLPYLSPEQTGRTNRPVDHRADLYSLGATFYEMLTGRLPFQSDDPLALVHAHLAKHAPRVAELRPDAPTVLSNLVMRLLAKAPADRYQSAFGVKEDLVRCLAVCVDGGQARPAPPAFELGTRDDHCLLEIPDRLYGRATSIATTQAALGRALGGSCSIVLVTGPGGVGKSALVAELREPVRRGGGYFISGKFDPYASGTPYAALSQAFERWVALALTEPEDRLAHWRTGILSTLGSHAAALTEVFPCLEQVLGKQPAAAALGPQESRNRFDLAFRTFVKTVCTAERPLVLFIDDWQWGDSASVALLSLLAMDETITHFMLVGAYRDENIAQDHPLEVLLAYLEAGDVPFEIIRLANLERAEIVELVRDGLCCSAEDARVLGELVHAKTQGNPLFARQFLRSICDEDCLSFDFDEHRWIWDAARITSHISADNVVDLVAGRLGQLPRSTSRLLQIAACLGTEFRVDTLALVADTSPSAALDDLRQAVTEELIIALDPNPDDADRSESLRFAFLHDPVWQACCSQLDEEAQQRIHLKIARTLQAGAPSAAPEHRLFAIVQHYRKAEGGLRDEAERAAVAELFMGAADQAYAAAAFQSAGEYLEHALALLPDDAWSTRYEAMLKAHSLLATCLALTGGTDRLETICWNTECRARTELDAARVRMARVTSLLLRARPSEAIARTLDLIESLGVSILRDPSPEEARRYFGETADWLTEARIGELPDLPDAPPEVAVVLEAAAMVNGPLYSENVHLCFVFVARMVRLCLERGLGPWSPVSLATFALMLAAGLHDIAKTRLLTAVTMKLFEKRFKSDSLVAPLNTSFGGFITHRYEHLRSTLPLLAEGAVMAPRSGNFEFAAYCAWWHSWHFLFVGAPLAQAEAEARKAVETCVEMRMERLGQWSELVVQLTLNLQGKADDPLVLRGENYDEARLLALALELKDYAEVLRIKLYRALLCFLFGSPKQAAAQFAEAEAYLSYAVGLYLVPIHYFYDTLANAAAHAEATPEGQTTILARISRNLEHMEVWARHAPMNHGHKLALMRAEQARITGRHWEALRRYQDAISGAAEQGFVQEEALACELCATFFLAQGQADLSRVHAGRSRRLYAAWGAAAKVAQLDSVFTPEPGSMSPISRLRSGDEPSQRASAVSASTGERGTGNLDIRSLLKAQQTLSQTVELDDLCAELIRLVLENAGAERAVLLYRDEGGWLVVGRGHADGDTVEAGLRLPLREARDLSQAIVNYVIRSGNAVVLQDAGVDPQFAGEPYIREHRVKAVLGLPVCHKGQLRLVAYLENNVIAGVFTEARLETLRLLSAQMAISMENALMYDRLETLVLRRTAELAEAKDRAEAASTAKSTFLTKMSHELRTPLNGILGYAQLLAQRSDDPELVEGLDVIRRSGEHLLTMISDLLDLAKTEAGRIELRLAKLRLRPFLESVISLVRSRAEEKALTLEWHAPLILPSQILADEVQLRRVLLNLLGNAIKFTDRGGVDLTVESIGATQADAGTRTATLRFTVSDTGPGLDPADRARIFLPFEQAGELGHQAEGTGLGLAISQELVRLMGGEIDVVSKPGRGSSFWFVLTVPDVREDSSPRNRGLPVVTSASLLREPPLRTAAGDPAGEQDAAAMAPPPESELRVLHDLALRGSLYRIVDRASQLETEHQAFARRLSELARAFDERAVLAWIERFIPCAARDRDDGATHESGVSS